MKILSMVLILMMLISCKRGTPIDKEPSVNSEFSLGTWGDDYTINGMHYAVQGNSNTIVVVNITKDSLECEYYKQQLQK